MKKTKMAHTPMTKIGMGDSYGSGIKQKMGTLRDFTGYEKVTSSQKKKPKTLA